MSGVRVGLLFLKGRCISPHQREQAQSNVGTLFSFGGAEGPPFGLTWLEPFFVECISSFVDISQRGVVHNAMKQNDAQCYETK